MKAKARQEYNTRRELESCETFASPLLLAPPPPHDASYSCGEPEHEDWKLELSCMNSLRFMPANCITSGSGLKLETLDDNQMTAAKQFC